MPTSTMEIVDDIYVNRPLTDRSTSDSGSDEQGETFDHSLLLVKEGDKYFQAKYSKPIVSQRRIAREVLYDIAELDVSALHVPAPSHLTRCPETMLSTAYIKKPPLGALLKPESIKEAHTLLLQEAEICERLLRHPHPRIAQYFGVVVSDDKIIGLAFKRYGVNLEERDSDPANPLPVEQRLQVVQDLIEAAEHLHEVGIVHNDINPYNVVFDEEDSAVLIDFDSAGWKGDELGIKKGTPGWARDDMERCEEENDDYGVDEIAKFLGFKLERE